MNPRSYNKNKGRSYAHTKTSDTNTNTNSEARPIRETIKAVTTATVSNDILVVASELADCLNIKEIHLFGTRSRKLILKEMEWKNDKLDQYKTINMSFWVNKNFINEALLNNKKFRKINENCYAFDTDSTNQTVKLFVTPENVLSNFWVNNISLCLTQEANSKQFISRAKIIGQQVEKEHLLKAGRNGSMHVNKANADFQEAVRRDPAFIIRAYKEPLKGYEPTPEVKRIFQNMTIPEAQFSVWKDKLADMYHIELLKNGNYYLKDVETYAAMKQISEYYKTCARFQKKTEPVIPAPAAAPVAQPTQAAPVAQLIPAAQSIQAAQPTQDKYSRVPVLFFNRNNNSALHNPYSLLHKGEDAYFGFNGQEQDSSRAVKLFEGAAQSGCIPAVYYLGVCYLQGDGVNKDPEKAFQHFQTAANQGLIVAQTELACLYLTGEGTEVNLEKGMQLMEYAARSNEPYALRCLAHFCEKGEGLPENQDRAAYFKTLSTSAYERRWQYQQEFYPEYKPGM